MKLLNMNDVEIEVEDSIKGVYNGFVYELNTEPDECYSDYQAVLLITNDEIINLIYKYQMPQSNFSRQEIWGTDGYYGDLYIDSHFIVVPIFDLQKVMKIFETIHEYIAYTIDSVINLDPDNFYHEITGYEVEKISDNKDIYLITFTLTKLNNKLSKYLRENISFDIYCEKEELKNNQFCMKVSKETDIDECIDETEELIIKYEEEII